MLPAQAAQSSLAAYWKFDESTAGATATDSSGNGNNLSPINSPTFSTDIPGGMNGDITDTHSVSFNGSSQYYTAADSSSLDHTDAVTLSTWVKFNAVSGTYQTILSKWNIGVAQQWTLQLNNDNHIGWWTGNGSTGADDLETSSTVTSNVWYHIVATASGTTKRLYVNGTLDGSKTNASVTMGVASSVGVGVGGKAAGSVEYLNGKIDDARVYSRVLSDAEAAALASGNESTTLTGGSTVTNQINTASAITDLQVISTAANPTVYVKLYVSHGTISFTSTSGLTFYDANGSSLGSNQPTNSADLHIGGSLSDVNTDLATLHYTRTDSGTGSDSLEASLVQPGEVFFPDNGHLYEYVAGPVSWSQAETAAGQSSKYGAQGYLATITSQSENDFIQDRLKSDSWIGASDAASEGVWKWVTGPETGQQFWQGDGSGNVVNSMYVHWNNPKTGGDSGGAEPNNYNNNENCAEFYYSNNGLWNDLDCSSTLGYIIEYGAPGDLPSVSTENVTINTVDTTPPTTPGTPSADTPTSDTTPTWTWTASTDSGTGLANPAYTVEWSACSTFCSFTDNGGTFTTNSTTFTIPTPVGIGAQWYFRVKATDAAGNDSAWSSTSSIIIDTTSPTVPGTPHTTSPTSDATPTWSWTASTDDGSGQSGMGNPPYAVEWSKDSNFVTGVSNSTSLTTSFTQPSGLSDGTWYFRVRGQDVVGNASNWSGSGSVIIDSSTPDTPANLGPFAYTNGGLGNDNTPTFSFDLSDSVVSDTVAYEIQIAGNTGFTSPIVDYTSALATQGSASFTVGQAASGGNYVTGSSGQSLSDGNYYWRIKAINAAGTSSSFAAAGTSGPAFKIDASAPTVSGTPSTTSPTNNQRPTWAWAAATDNGLSGLGSPAYTVEWSQDLNFNSGVSSDTSNTNAYTMPAALADGSWYFRYKATDALGNTSGWSAAGSVAIGTTPPVISNTNASTLSNSSEAITWTTDVQASSKIVYGPTSGYGSTTTEADTSSRLTSHSVTLTGLVGCTLYHFQAVSGDAFGNYGTGADSTFITTGCAGSANVSAHSDTQISPTSGGTLSLSGAVSMGVPANFAASSADFQIKQLDPTTSLKAIGTPSGVSLASNKVYDFKAMQDTATAIDSFNHVITVTMNYTPAEITDLIEMSLKIYRWDSGIGWRALSNCSVDTAAHTVTCTTPGFSTFALFGTALAVATPAASSSDATPKHTAKSSEPSLKQQVATTEITSGTSLPEVTFQPAAKNSGQSQAGSAHPALWIILGVGLAVIILLLAVRRRKKSSDS